MSLKNVWEKDVLGPWTRDVELHSLEILLGPSFVCRGTKGLRFSWPEGDEGVNFDTRIVWDWNQNPGVHFHLADACVVGWVVVVVVVVRVCVCK